MRPVPGAVSGQACDYIAGLVREYGKYLLNLGEFDLDINV